MVIVAGYLIFDPAERDSFLEVRRSSVVSTRQEHGCIEYALCPDPVDASRVVFLAKWEDLDDLAAHVALYAHVDFPGEPKWTSQSVVLYDEVNGARNFNEYRLAIQRGVKR